MRDRDDDPDASDVRRTLAGDVEAFAGIVARWQGPLLRLAHRFASERGQAEDLVQECFLRAFRGLSRWRGEVRFSTWLHAIAINLGRSHLRRRRPADEPAEGSREPAAPAEEPVPEPLARVRRAVQSLPRHYREAVSVVYFGELGVDEAARALGVRPGTLKARLHRARKLLEAELAREEDHGPR